MTKFQWTLIACFFSALIVFVWMGRYSLQPINRTEGVAAAYVLDRWTGKTQYLQRDASMPSTVEP